MDKDKDNRPRYSDLELHAHWVANRMKEVEERITRDKILLQQYAKDLAMATNELYAREQEDKK